MAEPAGEAARREHGSRTAVGRPGGLPPDVPRSPNDPTITAALRGFAAFAYLDNPLPSSFKQRLFVFLSRFCEVRSGVARLVGLLVGLSRPSGDPASPAQSVEEAVRLIRRPLPRGVGLAPLLARLAEGGPFADLPGPDTPAEEAVFACSAHVLVRSPDAAGSLGALRHSLNESHYQYLLIFLTFVRAAHFWSQVQTEPRPEADIEHLLAADERLAAALADEPRAWAREFARLLMDELTTSRSESARGEQRPWNGERVLDLTRAELVDRVAELRADRRAALNMMEDAIQARDALRESEKRLRAVAANLPNAAVFVVDPDLRFTLAAGQALVPAGVTPPDIEGRTLAETVPPDQLGEHTANYRRALAGEPFQVEHAAHGRQYSTHGVPLRAEDGRVTAVLTVSYDITDIKRVEAALRVSEDRLRLALTAARMGTWRWELNADNHQRDANLNRLLGRPPVESAGPLADFLACIHPADRDRTAEAFEASVRNGHNLNLEFRVPMSDGTVRWLRDRGDVFGGPEGPYLAGACVDVTELKEAEAGLRDAHARLEEKVAERTGELQEAMGRRSELIRRLATAQEDERRRVSRELHDTVGQLLAGLSLAFKAVEASGEVPPPMAATLADAQRVAETLGKEVHALAVRLRPTALDDLGLEAALVQLVREWSSRTGVRADFHTSGLSSGRLGTEIETTIYRVVQEALNNVARHARASVVSVVASRPDGEVTAMIEDDGVGFEPGTVSAGRLGLLGIRERAALVGGELDIESRPGGGTTVVVRLPVPVRGGRSDE